MIEAKEVDNDAVSKDTESEGKIEREVKDTIEPQPGTLNQDDGNRRTTRQMFQNDVYQLLVSVFKVHNVAPSKG